MADPVACRECGVRYDPVTTAFCPRCGSTAKGASVAPALEAARRADPGRRRVQASGAVLTVVGGLLVLLFLPVLILSAGLTGDTLDTLASQESGFPLPGGTLKIEVLNAGAPAVGLFVAIASPDGVPVANGTTDERGQFNATLGDQAIVVATIVTPGGNFTRRAVAIDGSTTTVRLDVATDAADSPHWAGLAPLLLVMRILVAVFLAVALVLVAAGISALRLRAWAFAVTGGLIGLLPVLLIFVASLSVGSLLILVVLGVPVAFIGRGRRYFGKVVPRGPLPPPPT